MRLPSPIARVRIADELWYSGDAILLPSVVVSLGEEARASTCEFSVYDIGLSIGGKFQKISFDAGGIDVPPELLEDPQPTGGTASPGSQAGVSSTQAGDLSPRVRAFLDMIAFAEGTSGPDGYRTMFTGRLFDDFSRHPNIVNRSGRFASTAAGRYQILKKTYDGIAPGLGITDFSPASQDRMCVELIRRRGALDEVESGNIAAAIRLCNREWASLPGSPYGQPVKTEAELLRVYNEALARYEGGNLNMASPAPTAEQPTATTAEPLPQSASKGTEIIIELGFDPIRLISFHFIHTGTTTSFDTSAHITTFKGQSVRWLLTRVPQTRAFENMSLREVTERFTAGTGIRLEIEGDGPRFQHLDMTGITPFELINREAQNVGFSVSDRQDIIEIKPTARPEFSNIVLDEDLIISATFNDQARAASAPTPDTSISNPGTDAAPSPVALDRATGQTDQQAPLETGGTDAPPNSDGVVPGRATPPVGGTPAPSTASNATGTPATQVQTEGDRQVGELTSRTEKVTNEDGSVTDISVAEQTVTERGKITKTTTRIETRNPPGTMTTTVTTRIATTEGTTTITETTRDGQTSRRERQSSEVDPDVYKTLNTTGTATASDVEQDQFGLPRQQPGAIDLADGRAEPAALVDESQRSKGFESEVVLRLAEESLEIVPGQIIGLTGRFFPEPFNREWRVATVTHDLAASTTTLSIYTPQAPLPGGSVSVESATIDSSQQPTPGGWILPCGGRLGDGYGPRPGRSAGYRHKILDIANSQGTPLLSMNDGVVTKVVTGCSQGNSRCGGGYGNYCVVEHAGGIETLYAHCVSIEVTQGQRVQRGQVIARMGSTGFSTGPHLHLKVNRKGGEHILLSTLGLQVPGGSVTGSRRSGFEY